MSMDCAFLDDQDYEDNVDSITTGNGTASKQTDPNEFARRHGVSIDVANALIRDCEIASDVWLAETGHTARPSERRRSALSYARSNQRREKRSGGSRGVSAIPQEEWMMADFAADPIAILLLSESRSSEDVDEGSSLPTNLSVAPKTGSIGKRRRQQLRAARTVAVEAGQLSFSGFGWAAGA